MKKVFVGILCLSSFAAFAQDKGARIFIKAPEGKATISAKLDQAPNDTTVVLWEPYSGEIDSAVIKDHRFELEMPMKKGGSVYIMQIGKIPEKNATLVYLDNGKMNIVGKGSNFDNAKFSGEPYVKEWQEVMAMTDPLSGDGKKMEELQKKNAAAMAIGDEDVALATASEYSALDEKMRNNLKKWMAKHPNSGVNGYILTVYFGRQEKFIDSVYAKLGDHAKSSRILQRHYFPGKIDPSPLMLKVSDDAAPATEGKVKNGAVAPVFEIPDVDSNMVSLSSFKGKYVFLDFWASWCSPCLAIVPHLKEVNEKYKGKNFVMIGVSMDTKKDAWLKAIKQYDLNWLNVSNLKGWAEPVGTLYGVRAIPSNVLIGPDGNVIANDLFGKELADKLNELLH